MPFLFVKRIAIAAPSLSVTVIATFSNGITALLTYARTCIVPTADRVISSFHDPEYAMLNSLNLCFTSESYYAMCYIAYIDGKGM